MAFEFKKLSDVNVIETMKDGLNVLVEDGGEIVKLAANSMIPEDVALKSDIPEDIAVKSDIPDAIPVPATAEVGQVVAVKAVDENGKPTAWEAVTVGGGSIVILHNNDEGSSLYWDEACTQLVTPEEGIELLKNNSIRINYAGDYIGFASAKIGEDLVEIYDCNGGQWYFGEG